MKRTSQVRTYQGKVWAPDRELAPADLAVSVDMRGAYTYTPQQRAKAQREVLEYLVNHPEEREFQELALKTLYGCELQEVNF